MSASMVVILVAGAIFLYVVVRLLRKAGRRGGSGEDSVSASTGTVESGAWSSGESPAAGVASGVAFVAGGGDFGGAGASDSWSDGSSANGGDFSGGDSGGDGGGGGGD